MPVGNTTQGSFADRWFAQIAVLPTVLLMLAVFLVPVAVSAYFSILGWSATGIQDAPFVGFENYELLLTDNRFWWSVGVTLLYTAIAVALEMAFGLAIALLLNIDVPGIGIFRALMILPMMMTPIVAALAWKLLLDPAYGVVNYLLGANVVWLGQSGTAFAAVTLVNIWQNTPYVAILLLAGLRTLPREPFEAATIDGATRFQVFRYCTLPLLKPYILIALLLRVIFEFRSFDNVYLMTGGGPADSTLLLSVYTYLVTFVSFDLTLGAAASWLMLLATVAICVLFMVVLGRKEKADTP